MNNLVGETKHDDFSLNLKNPTQSMRSTKIIKKANFDTIPTHIKKSRSSEYEWRILIC